MDFWLMLSPFNRQALPIIQAAVTSSDSENATVETDMLIVMANLYK